MPADYAGSGATIDPAEIDKFERLASEWWDPDGQLKPLHRLNPVRLAFIRDVATAHFGRDARAGRPFAGLRIADIGCGGGLLSEPMARLGAAVVGADPAPGNIAVARLHAERSRLAVDYRAVAAEDLAAAGETFDVVLAMEVVEHVADLDAFLAACASLVRPGGLFFAATINRTLRAFALAIVGAEYVLRWLPRGTHDYSRLVRPAELESALSLAGLATLSRAGVSYSPFADTWSRSNDMGVNYMLAAERRPPEPLLPPQLASPATPA
jgi:2-polyprenyl-6-hydroxyphenyl methylase/3-demethylubiquinone-9 3-methyltransferase